ncbi:ClpXP protease specificity-enhancing factor [Vibrio sp. JC009]|uniref:ClpXP protease specificity-enhancing factor n=1 Tax=Vibrio sp. JC009 TaxID=2912314 RepID=UPI0023B06E1C|nr:ClpXP protease specificity-enhancing factor [Vibrio sp. JC009]WED21450.1 ClpXP protease specificity-enhancing factor [Vibrio sp. JC009]
MEIEAMKPRRPYLLRAFYDWLVDNDLTPHLVVDATLVGVRVPVDFIQDGQIILNVAPRAVGNLEMGNEAITFNARFGGRPHSVIVPLYAVQAIYARENGAGTMFEPEEAYEGAIMEADSADELTVVDSIDDEPTPDDEPPKPKGRPSLRVIK